MLYMYDHFTIYLNEGLFIRSINITIAINRCYIHSLFVQLFPYSTYYQSHESLLTPLYDASELVGCRLSILFDKEHLRSSSVDILSSLGQ